MHVSENLKGDCCELESIKCENLFNMIRPRCNWRLLGEIHGQNGYRQLEDWKWHKVLTMT
jgi:hypothetical protein